MTRARKAEAEIELMDAFDIKALFWKMRSTILKLPRYSFLLNDGGGVKKVEDRLGKWIEVDDAANLCEVESYDAMLSTVPPAQQELKPHTEAEVQELLSEVDGEWLGLEIAIRRILGVPAP